MVHPLYSESVPHGASRADFAMENANGMRIINGEMPGPAKPGEIRWKLRRLRAALRWSRAQLGDAPRHPGDRKSHNTIGNYEAGHRLPPDDFIDAISTATGVPLEWFYDGVPSDPPVVNSTDRQVRGSGIPRKNDEILGLSEISPVKWTLIPDWGTVPAGDWQGAPEEPNMVAVDMDVDPATHFAVRVSGDSLEPRLKHGYQVIIRRTPRPVDGVISYVRNGDNQVTLKVVRFVDGKGWQLESINPERPAPSADLLEMIGIVIAVREEDTTGVRP